MVLKQQTLTLSQLVARFLEDCRYLSPRTGRHLSTKTLSYYQMCLDGLLYFAHQNDWPPLEELTREHLRDFMAYLSEESHRWAGDGRRATYKKASPATVHHYLKVAKTFFNWCYDEEYLKENPAARLRLPSPNYKDVEPYTDEEVQAMLEVCEHDLERGNRYLGARNTAIVSVFIDTGLRLTELSEMKLSELDPQLNQLRVLGKGSKLRVVPINGQARKALKLYLREYRRGDSDRVWLSDDGRPLSFYSIRTIINRLKVRAGVRSGGSAHRFRHYFATRYLENGGDLNSLRLLLGHATLYMVLRYTKFVQVRKALDEHSSVSPLDRLYNNGRQNHIGGDDRWGWRR